MIVHKEEIIKQISKTYSQLTSECQQKLSNCSKVLVLPKGEIVVREGQYSDKIFFYLKAVPERII